MYIIKKNKNNKWIIIKKGSKRATRIFETKLEAVMYAKDKYPDNYEIDDDNIVEKAVKKHGKKPLFIVLTLVIILIIGLGFSIYKGYINIPGLNLGNNDITDNKNDNSDDQEAEFTVSFSGVDFKSQIIVEGGKIVKPADPVKEGYVFKGWYANSAYTEAFDFNSAISEDTTLYAKWEEITYTIIYNGSSLQPQLVKYGDKVVKPANPTKEGYVFKGWYSDSAYIETFDFNTIILEDTALYAKWEEISYTIIFNGVTLQPQLVKYGDKVIKPTDPIKAGYTFKGWYSDSACTKEFDFNSEIKTNINLYAKWEETTYIVSFNGATVANQIIKEGQKAIKPADPIKNGYTFEGWYSDLAYTQIFNFNIAITSNITLYAKWIESDAPQPVVNFTVTFVGANITDQIISAGELATKPTDPIKSGYIFEGWYTTSSYIEEFDFNTPITSDTTIYIKWLEITYTVSFDGVALDEKTIKEGEKVEKPADPEQEGYTFIGWYSDSAYTEEFDFNTPITSNTTIYVKWEKITYTVSFDGANVDIQYVKYEEKATKPTDPEQEGYTFIGWYTTSAYTEKFDFNTPITSNTTIYAKWQEDSSHSHEIVDSIIYDDFQIHFLELGNQYTGDSTYIKVGDVDILIDAGSRKNSAAAIKDYVDDYCTDGKLEYVIGTHGDQDHIAGFVGESTTPKRTGILYQYEIGTIIKASYTNKTTQIYSEYLSAISYAEDNGATVVDAGSCYNNTNGGQRIYNLAEDITLEILYNYYYFNKSDDENNYSVCVMLNYKEQHFMLTGDLELEGEEKLAEYYDGSTEEKTLPKVQLFKAGHHGSKTSSNDCLLDIIQPEIVCVCCCAGSTEYTANYNNVFPTQDMINRVAKHTDRVYVTTVFNEVTKTFESLNGNIIISCNGIKVGVSASNNIIKLKDSEWFNQTVYVDSSGNISSGKGKDDFFTISTSGVTAVKRRVWPSV